MFNPIGSKATLCSFAHTPDLILMGHESGKVALFDAKTGDEVLNNERAHMDVVTDLQLSPDRSYFITSSKDKTARVRLNAWDVHTVDAETPLVARDQDSDSPENVYDGDTPQQRCNCTRETLRLVGRWPRRHERDDDIVAAR